MCDLAVLLLSLASKSCQTVKYHLNAISEASLGEYKICEIGQQNLTCKLTLTVVDVIRVISVPTSIMKL
jgi:hypothetical protein